MNDWRNDRWDYWNDWNDWVNTRYWVGLGVSLLAIPATAIAVSAANQDYYNEGVYMQPQGNSYVVVSAPIGAVISTLPEGYIPVSVNNSNYYYYGGAFYQASSGGYVVVQAPVGAVVPFIPDGYEKTLIRGTTYYQYGGVRYQPVYDGGNLVYKVV